MQCAIGLNVHLHYIDNAQSISSCRQIMLHYPGRGEHLHLCLSLRYGSLSSRNSIIRWSIATARTTTMPTD